MVDSVPYPVRSDSLGPRVQVPRSRRVGGLCLLVGSLVMIAGAAVWAGTGTDIAAALADGSLDYYLNAASASREALAINLGLWVIGAALLGAGTVILSGGEPEVNGAGRGLTQAAGGAGFGIAAVAFLMWFGLIRAAVGIDTGAAEALAWSAWNLDVLATSLLIGLAPLALALTLRSRWVPTWLVIWAAVAAIAAVASWVAIPIGAGSTLGMVIVPVGIGWCIVAGVVALASSKVPSHYPVPD